MLYFTLLYYLGTTFTTISINLTTTTTTVNAFEMTSARRRSIRTMTYSPLLTPPPTSSTSTTQLKMAPSRNGEEDEFEYARRRRNSRWIDDDDEEEQVRSRRRGYYDDEEEDEDFRRNRDRDYDEEYDYDEDDYDYDEDDYEEEDEYDGIIPNAQLDQMDPDGSIERISELGGDPKFWRDASILAFLVVFGSLAGPLDEVVLRNGGNWPDVNDMDFTQFYAK